MRPVSAWSRSITSTSSRALASYAWLMPQLGYATGHGDGRVHGWLSPAGSFWIKAAAPHLGADPFHKDRVGLAEIAFAAETRAQVDALARALDERGVPILD